jgi:hypothetical protein
MNSRQPGAILNAVIMDDRPLRCQARHGIDRRETGRYFA